MGKTDGSVRNERPFPSGANHSREPLRQIRISTRKSDCAAKPTSLLAGGPPASQLCKPSPVPHLERRTGKCEMGQG
jgi:hypothetical protein